MINLLSFLSLAPVSPMSHGWPSTRTKYLTEENCLPTAASVSLASSTDSWVLAQEMFKNLLQAELLEGSSPARCCILRILLHLKDGCVYIYPSENLLLCKYLKLRPPWEQACDTDILTSFCLKKKKKAIKRHGGSPESALRHYLSTSSIRKVERHSWHQRKMPTILSGSSKIVK